MSDTQNAFIGRTALGLIGLMLSVPAFGQTVTTDGADYARGDTLTASWADVTGLLAFSYVAIGDSSGADGEWSFAQVVGLGSSGEYEFTHLPQGCDLEVRVYRSEGLVAARSAPFDVDCGVRDAVIGTDAPSYFVGDDIEFIWSGASGQALDWVGTATSGSSDSAYLDFNYTDPTGFSGPYEGSQLRSGFLYKAIDNLPPGEYEARLYYNNGFDVQARSEFSISLDPSDPSTITTDRENYTPRTPVTVEWTLAPGFVLDWVAIGRRALPSTDLFSYVDIYGDQTWQYTSGLIDGSLEFTQIKELGQYAARGFEDNTYIPFVNQALFSVDFAPGSGSVPGAAVTLPKVDYYKGEPVELTFTGATGNADDILLISESSFAPDDPAGVEAWVYFDQAGLEGTVDGVHTFYEFLNTGTYIARGMSSDGYNGMGASDVFSVEPDPDTLPAVWTVPTCVAPDATTIDVFYKNISTPPNGVWVGIWEEGADRYSFSFSWSYVPSGSADGTGEFWFSGFIGVDATLPVGRYELRLMNSARRIGYTGFFDVDPACPTPELVTDRAFYQVGQRVQLSWAEMEQNPEYEVGIMDTSMDPSVDDYESEEFTFSTEAGTIEFDALTPGIFTGNAFHQHSRVVVGQSDEFIICPDGEVPDCTNECRDETIVNPFDCVDTGPIDSADSGATDSADSADSGDSGDSGSTGPTGPDSGVPDSGSTTGGDSGIEDSGSTGPTGPDSGVPDSGSTTGGDSGIEDSGSTSPTGPDSGVPDSGSTTGGDSGIEDSGSTTGGDSGIEDSGSTTGGDSGIEDSGSTGPTGPDSGVPDSGSTGPTGPDSGAAGDSGSTGPTGPDSGVVGDSGGTTTTTTTTGSDSGVVGDSGGTTTTTTTTGSDSGVVGDSGGTTTTTTGGDSGLVVDSGGTTTTTTTTGGDSGVFADSGSAPPTGTGDSGDLVTDSDSGASGTEDSGTGMTTPTFPTGGDSGADMGSDSGGTGGLIDSGTGVTPPTFPTGGDSGATTTGADSGTAGTTTGDSGTPAGPTGPDSGLAGGDSGL
jgi:hypothetical protein